MRDFLRRVQKLFGDEVEDLEEQKLGGKLLKFFVRVGVDLEVNKKQIEDLEGNDLFKCISLNVIIVEQVKGKINIVLRECGF